MGIYADIQADLREAMLDDLSDAVSTLVITEEASSINYNPAAGAESVTSTPVIYTMDCIALGTDEEGKDNADATTDYVSVIVLDSDRTIPEFRPGMKATITNKRTLVGSNHEIGKVTIDPVGATHNLKCRRL